jgi:hypothetical protein
MWVIPDNHKVAGYGAQRCSLNTPFEGQTNYYLWTAFDPAWALLDNMAVTIEE